jgi:hypothetical protein
VTFRKEPDGGAESPLRAGGKKIKKSSPSLPTFFDSTYENQK